MKGKGGRPKGQIVPPEIRRELQSVLEILKISQKEWAERAEVSGTITSAMAGITKQAVRNPGIIYNLTRVLEERLRLLQEEGRVNPVDVKQVEDGIYELRHMYGLVKDRDNVAAGMIVSENAGNFIHTKWQDKVLAGVGNPLSPLLIRGPRFSGATTLAHALAEKADRNGLQVSYVDLSLYRPGLEREHKDQRYMSLTKLIIDEVLSDNQILKSSKLETASIWPELLMRNVVRGFINNNIRTMLVLDQIEALMDIEGENVLVKRLRELVYSIRTMPTPRTDLLPRVVLVGHDTLDGNDPFLGSNIVRTGNLTQQEVGILAIKVLRDSSNADSKFVAGEAWRYFGGQPFMTHRALEVLSKQTPPYTDLFNDRAIGRVYEGVGRKYVEHIEGLIKHPLGKDKFQAVLASENGLPFGYEYERLINVGLVYLDDKRLFVPPHLKDIADEMHRREAALGPGPERR